MRDQTAFRQAELAAGKAGRRHHWRLADMMADTVTDLMLKGWFMRFFMEGERLPICPRRRMLWLVEVRAGFSGSRDSLGTLMASAAIRREALRLKRLKSVRRKLEGRKRIGGAYSHDGHSEVAGVPVSEAGENPQHRS